MSASNRYASLLVAGLVACGNGAPDAGRPASEAGVAAPARNGVPAVDNTARNERDRDGTTPTPLDQSESAADIEITAQIRRAIMQDGNMSVSAQNSKIITNGGVVTLRGVVANEGEKQAIEAKAAATAGVVRVDNQLEAKTE